MIKFNELRAFYSSNERDAYNEGTKQIVYINPEHIIALEPKEEWGNGIWPSVWTATSIYTVRGKWVVEGSVCAVESIISNAQR